MMHFPIWYIIKVKVYLFFRLILLNVFLVCEKRIDLFMFDIYKKPFSLGVVDLYHLDFKNCFLSLFIIRPNYLLHIMCTCVCVCFG